VNLHSLIAAVRGHRVTIIEGGVEVANVEPMPGYCQMRCSCGWQNRTYWGADHAKEMGQRHVFIAVTGTELTPGGGNAK